jgi:hypothetical protein
MRGSEAIRQLDGEGLLGIREEIASLVASVLGEQTPQFAVDKARLIVQHAERRVKEQASSA